jgi:hypothetical protein
MYKHSQNRELQLFVQARKRLDFYRTKHSRREILWHRLLSFSLFVLAIAAVGFTIWYFWFRSP